MQHEITRTGPLLDSRGRLSEPGWARSPLPVYDRGAIRAPAFRIKEWDYYLVTFPGGAVAFTVADNSYMGLLSISVLDLENRSERTESVILPLTWGRLGLPADSRTGDVRAAGKGMAIDFRNDGTRRRLFGSMPGFDGGKGFEAEIELFDEPPDSMVIATPFEGKARHFYFNRKIVGMRARGYIAVGSRRIKVEPESAWGLLDWGRGVWPYSGTWYWSAAQGQVGSARFGWNLGYGFGQTSAATENMLFHDGRCHKLEAVEFHIPTKPDGQDDFMAAWNFTSSDGRFEMEFRPRLDRAAFTAVGPLMSDQHQVFGLFSGRARLDDGAVLEVKDFPGFAEKVRNRW